MDFHIYLQKLQNLPLNQKKIILWTIVVLLALGMGFLWFKVSISRLAKLEESIKKIEIPSVNSNIEENK